MQNCRLCRSSALSDLADLGSQSISNRFLASASADEALFHMVLARCQACGLIQLRLMPPAAELTPRYSWIAYNEPESHLDELADVIARLPGLSADAQICGLSTKDDTLLRRMRERGFAHTWRIAVETDLGADTPGAGVETVQARLDQPCAAALAAKHGKSQVVIARHIVEHAQDLKAFLEALAELMAPDGYIIVEVPDCRGTFEQGDWTILWEEHAAYFTPATFPVIFQAMRRDVIEIQEIPNGFEDLLVGIARGISTAPMLDGRTFASANDVATAMPISACDLECERKHIRDRLAEYRKRGGIAVLGAGHLACAFINYLNVGDCIDCIVDDDPKKQMLFMPGSRLPIHSSKTLLEKNIGLCLLSVNREIEDKVIAKNQEFVARGGTFASIYKNSKRSFGL